TGLTSLWNPEFVISNRFSPHPLTPSRFHAFRIVGRPFASPIHSPRLAAFPAITPTVPGSWTPFLTEGSGPAPVPELGLIASVSYCMMGDVADRIEPGRAMRRDSPVGRLRRRRTKLYERWLPQAVNSAGRDGR